MKNIKNTMKTSKTNTRSQKTGESSQPNNRDHQRPQGEAEQTPRSPSPYMTKANFEALKAASQFRAVYCDGPFADQDKAGDEIPRWSVFIGTADHTPVSKVYECNTQARAQGLAQVMSRDRGIELIDESTAATN